MNKKILILFILIFSFFSLVNAEIVNSSNERVYLGNGKYQIVSYSGKPFMQNSAGVWQNFNEVVNLRESNRELTVGWNNETIRIKPFVVYRDNKVYAQDVSENLWSQLNWRNEINSQNGFYKFETKLNKVAELSAVGFEIYSSEPLKYDFKDYWVSFGEIKISFEDLKESGFELSLNELDRQTIEVRVIDLPSLRELNLDPIITQDYVTFDQETHQKVNWACDIGGSPSWYCTITNLNPHKVGYSQEGDCSQTSSEIRRTFRAFYDWNSFNLPENAVIEKVEADIKVEVGCSSSQKQFQLKKMNNSVWYLKNYYGDNCQTLWGHINNTTVYATDDGWNTSGWKLNDLGSQAVQDLQSHLDWFSLGIKAQTEYNEQDYAGLANQVKFADQKLYITYFVPFPDVTIVSPNGGEILGLCKGDTSINFNFSDENNLHDNFASLYYSSSKGGFSNLIVADLNLNSSENCWNKSLLENGGFEDGFHKAFYGEEASWYLIGNGWSGIGLGELGIAYEETSDVVSGKHAQGIDVTEANLGILQGVFLETEETNEISFKYKVINGDLNFFVTDEITGDILVTVLLDSNDWATEKVYFTNENEAQLAIGFTSGIGAAKFLIDDVHINDINAATVNECDYYWNYSSVATGNYYLDINAWNELNETQESSENYFIIQTNTAPIITVISPNGGEFASNFYSVDFNVTDVEGDDVNSSIWVSVIAGNKETLLTDNLRTSDEGACFQEEGSNNTWICGFGWDTRDPLIENAYYFIDIEGTDDCNATSSLDSSDAKFVVNNFDTIIYSNYLPQPTNATKSFIQLPNESFVLGYCTSGYPFGDAYYLQSNDYGLNWSGSTKINTSNNYCSGYYSETGETPYRTGEGGISLACNSNNDVFFGFSEWNGEKAWSRVKYSDDSWSDAALISQEVGRMNTRDTINVTIDSNDSINYVLSSYEK